MNTTNSYANAAVSILRLQMMSGKLRSGDTLTVPDLFDLKKFPLTAYEGGQIGKEFCRLVNNKIVRKSGKKGNQTVYVVI